MPVGGGGGGGELGGLTGQQGGTATVTNATPLGRAATEGDVLINEHGRRPSLGILSSQ
jgi:hypothetical protein